MANVDVSAAADQKWNVRTALPLPSREYGVGERIKLKPVALANPVGVSWRISTAGIPALHLVNEGLGTATFTAPDVPPGTQRQTVLLELLRAAGANKRLLAQVSLDIVAPASVKLQFVEDSPVADWAHGGFSPFAKFIARFVVGPPHVCFDNIDIRETAGPNTWVCTGICKNDPWYVRQAATAIVVTTHQHHDPNAPEVTRQETVSQGEGIRHFDNKNWENWVSGAGAHSWDADGTHLNVQDTVGSGYSPAQVPAVARSEFAPKPSQVGDAVAGEGSLKIPVHYRVHGSTDLVGRKFGENTHHHVIQTNGTMIIEKGGVRRVYPWIPPPA